MKDLALKISESTAPSATPHRTFGLFSLALWLFVILISIVSTTMLKTHYEPYLQQHIANANMVAWALSIIVVLFGLVSVHLFWYAVLIPFSKRYIIACVVGALIFYFGGMAAVVMAVKSVAKEKTNEVEIQATTAKYDNRISRLQFEANQLKTSYMAKIDSLNKAKVPAWAVWAVNKQVLTMYKDVKNIDSTVKADIQRLEVQKSFEVQTLQQQAYQTADKSLIFGIIIVIFDFFCNFSLVWLQTQFRKNEAVHKLPEPVKEKSNMFIWLRSLFARNKAKEAVQQTIVVQTINNTNVQNNYIIEHELGSKNGIWYNYICELNKYSIEELENMDYRAQKKLFGDRVNMPTQPSTRSTIKAAVIKSKLKNQN